MSEDQVVLILGGSGMLRPVVRALLERGNTVIAVARRPHHAAPPNHTPGEFVPVQGEWSDPEALVASILAVIRHRKLPQPLVQGAIVWVHSPYREALLAELHRVLAPDATVLQLWGSGARDPRDVMEAESSSQGRWRLRHLFLGYRYGPSASRWLTDEEISQATIHTWDTDGKYLHAGQLDPWEHRP